MIFPCNWEGWEIEGISMGMRERERERATATTGAAGTDGWTEVLREDKKGF